jgi:NAD(P)-dependent dehydrogenase (short-subunit alcohol dehydrogenase family)
MRIEVSRIEGTGVAFRNQGCRATYRIDISLDSDGRAPSDVETLVNLNGVNTSEPFEKYTEEDFVYIFRSNLPGIVHSTQRVGASWVERRSGRTEWGRYNSQVNCIAPSLC